MSRHFFSALRLIFSLTVAAWAINWVLASAGANLKQEFQTCNWFWIATAIFLTAVGTALSSYRWSTLLALQHVNIKQWDAFRLTMIGIFFNLFGLGGVGGDFFKAFYVRGHAGEHKAEAMLSILVDRILGLLGLFVVALLSLPFVWSELRQAPPQVQSMAGFVVLVSVVGGTGVTLVLSRDHWLPASTKEGLKKLGSHMPAKIYRIVEKLVRSLDLYRTQLPQLFKALALSALVHTLATFSVYSVGQAFHIREVGIRFYFLGVQVANTISAVPITPSGLGSRDLVLKEFLIKLGGGPERCGLIPFGLSCIIVLWSLVGGIFFVMARRSGEVPAEMQEEEQEK